METVLVKLGGSLITDKSKPFTDRVDVIERLSREIHEARKERKMRIVVGHGGGSYPHEPAARYMTHKGIIGKDSYRGIAEVQDAAARLNRVVVSALLKAKENAVTIQPSASLISSEGRITEWYTKPLEKLIEYDMLPVVYGDIGIDSKMGCCILSTEELFRYLSKKLGADRVIMCGKTDGVFTGDPNKNSNVRHIPEITRDTFPEIKRHLSASDGIDVTGGMIHKIEQALEIAGNGASVSIINGNSPGNLRDSLIGRNVMGTLIR